jgi:hypothetical protein
MECRGLPSTSPISPPGPKCQLPCSFSNPALPPTARGCANCADVEPRQANPGCRLLPSLVTCPMRLFEWPFHVPILPPRARAPDGSASPPIGRCCHETPPPSTQTKHARTNPTRLEPSPRLPTLAYPRCSACHAARAVAPWALSHQTERH